MELASEHVGVGFRVRAYGDTDPVAHVGWNTDEGGGALDADKGQVYVSLEGDYDDPVRGHSSEAHIVFAAPGEPQRRMLSGQQTWDTGHLSVSMQGNEFVLYDGEGTAAGNVVLQYVNGDLYLNPRNVFVGGPGEGAYLALGDLETSNAWVDARGTASNIDLNLRAKGAGRIRFTHSAPVATDLPSLLSALESLGLITH